MENENVRTARDIMEGVRKAKTREIYHKRIEVLKYWINENQPMSYDLDEGQRTKEKRQASISVISSYRSSICMLYEESQLKFNDSTQLAFNQNATSIGLCPSCIFISPTNFFSAT